MNVQGVGHGFGVQPLGQRGRETGKAEGDTAIASPTIADGPGKERGVIRLLQEGHFKGVADLRLRINFFDELSAISNGKASEAAEAEIGAVLAAVDSVVEDFLATPDLADEISTEVMSLHAAFEETVSGLVEAFSGAEAPSTVQLVADIQGAFDNFTAALLGFLADQVDVPIDESEGDEVGSTGGILLSTTAVEEIAEGEEGAPELSEEFQTFIDSLQSEFTDALSIFNVALESASSVLPDRSDPNGNGVAYARFLDILTALQGGGEPTGASVPDDGLSLEA